MPDTSDEELERPDNKESSLSKIVSREEWAAYPPSKVDRPLEHPIGYLAFSAVKVEPEKKEGSEETVKKRGRPKKTDVKEDINYAAAVKQIQTRDMSFYGMSDIKSNFLIGEDGLVFEGRGWHVQSGRPNAYPGYEGKFLEITFMGDYNSDKARQATGHLLGIGKENKYLGKHIQLLRKEHRAKEKHVEDLV